MQVVTYPGRGTDDGEDYEDWSMYELRERVKLVQELERLADRMVDKAIHLVRLTMSPRRNSLSPKQERCL